jgi:hypothetical protein
MTVSKGIGLGRMTKFPRYRRRLFKLLDRFWSLRMYAENLEYQEGKDVHTTRARFKQLFLDQLSYSPYLPELRKLNKGCTLICNLTQKKVKKEDEILPVSMDKKRKLRRIK